MKVEIELPDFCEKRTLRLFAGVELVAMKEFNGKWKVKTAFCDNCGECCRNLNPRKHFFGVVGENNECEYLEKQGDKYFCKIIWHRPWYCCADPHHHISKGICCIEYEEQ